MSPELEALARAIAYPLVIEGLRNDWTAPARGRPLSQSDVERQIDRVWRNYVDSARYALTQLREPTEAMKRIGIAAVQRSDRLVGVDDWRAMIDHILNGEPE